jgi:hypothetical protein
MASMAADTSTSAFGPEEQPKSAITIFVGNKVLVLVHKSIMAASIMGFILFCSAFCIRVVVLKKIYIVVVSSCSSL